VKGIFFQKPFEFSLNVSGESWRQSETISGTLTVRNRGNETASLAGTRVELALGQLKKVHARTPGALETLSKKELESPATLAPGAEATLEWSFPTHLNFPITDVSDSPFLVYGQGAEAEKIGFLQANVLPSTIIEEFLDRFVVAHRFVVKSKKWSKKRVAVKLGPSSAKQFANLEYAQAEFRFQGDTLLVNYIFQVKKMVATPANVETKKEKRELEQSFGPTDYRTSSGRPNHERIEAAIAEALKEAEPKL
jgi:hypothetical protein